MSNSTSSEEHSIVFNEEVNDDNTENVEKHFDVPTTSKLPANSKRQSESKFIVTRSQGNVNVSTQKSLVIESLLKMICTMFETDGKNKEMMYKLICKNLRLAGLLSESYVMDEFEGIRSQYQKIFLNLLTSAIRGDILIDEISPICPRLEITSRYSREFKEEEFIACGGFGQVYKVQHNLDGNEYAVKKIPIKAEGIKSVNSYLSEVKTFASMNHPNIVQYKGAWLEIGPPRNTATIHQKNETFTSVENQTRYIYNQGTSVSFTEIDRSDNTDFQIHFEHSVNSHTSTKPKSPEIEKKKKKCLSVRNDTKEVWLQRKELNNIKSLSKAKVKWTVTLYIQMAFCKTTLKQWLKTESSVSDPNKALVSKNDLVIRNNKIQLIFIQLLSGLEYIHLKGVVHHDIKPSNIFISNENGTTLIQLGDFGLACPLQSACHNLSIGTKLYAAPEQMKGECNQKSDMYSLGIVLYELVENFHTDMERVKQITELSKGNIPSHLFVAHPKMAEIIKNLTVADPKLRPDTTSLLKTLKPTETQQIEELKMQLAEKDEKISQLTELLKKNGIKDE